MEIVHGIKVTHFGREEFRGIHEVYVLIPCRKRILVGFADDRIASFIEFGRFIIKGVNHKYHRQLGVPFADVFKERFMGCFQVFMGRGIIIVIHNEASQITRCDMVSHCQFAHCASGEAVVTAIGIKSPADYITIGISRTGNASALGNRRAVEGNRSVGTGSRRADTGTLGKAYFESFNTAV